jgi:hypothetical protein
MANIKLYTVRRVDEVVRHQHLVTQDQFTQVSKNFSNIPAEDFTINIELFLQTFTNVKLVRQNWLVSKATSPGREPRFSNLLSYAERSYIFTLYSLLFTPYLYLYLYLNNFFLLFW